MKAITDYISKQNNLHLLSAWITLGIMLILFILAQIFSFTSLADKSKLKNTKMEVRELIKLSFTPQKLKKQSRTQGFEIKKASYTKTQGNNKKHSARKSQNKMNISSLVQGFDSKKLISKETRAARRGVASKSINHSAGVSTDVSRQSRNLEDFDILGQLSNHRTAMASSKRAARGGNGGPKISLGGSSSVGTGTGSGTDGVALSGRGTSRATRGSSSGVGGASISLPSGSGGGNASLDLHALIKWMKAHPGAIPKLVAYEMGQQGGDLSSSIPFMLNGRNFRFFLSCNETELLLRICLVEGNNFTLLKDNGIREESNFLTIGDVVRENSKITSLISSRRAPGDKAAAFYQIFWAWWKTQEK